MRHGRHGRRGIMRGLSSLMAASTPSPSPVAQNVRWRCMVGLRIEVADDAELKVVRWPELDIGEPSMTARETAPGTVTGAPGLVQASRSRVPPRRFLRLAPEPCGHSMRKSQNYSASPEMGRGVCGAASA